MSRKACTLKRALSMLLAAVVVMGCVSLPLPTMETKAATDYPFMDTSLSFEERAADLVSRFTLEEKAAQVGNNNPAISRLGVSRYDYWKEGLHGVANLDEGSDQTATSFPYTIAMAATWDTELIEEIGRAISDEARGFSNQGLRPLSYWSPTINLARDPRWGRNMESYGEDVHLTSVLGTSMVDGWQGTNEENNGYLKVISTLKHYAANNSEYNRHNGSSSVSNVYMREYYTRAFKNIIQETDIRQVMSSYNRINGTPASASEYLLDTLLRKTFGFQGYVTSDCGAIQNMVEDHKWVPEGYDHVVTYEEAVMFGELAGCDMDCGFVYPQHAVGAVRSGLISEDVLDKALVRIFTQRFYTGEFDPAEEVPWRSEEYSYANIVENEANVQLAEDSSDESIVLMKNEAAQGEDAPILPLDPDASQNVVVVGDIASQNILGAYSGVPSKENISTPLQGIENLLGHSVNFIQGGNMSGDSFICNSRNLKLIKGDEEVILTPTEATGFFGGCMLENNANVGYIKAYNHYYYPNVDISGTTAIAIETSGGGDTLQGTVEIHIGSPDGMTLTKIDTEQTGSWGNYVYFQNDVTSLGGYTNRDLYVVFTPSVQEDKEIEFDENDTAAIQNADVVIACIGSHGGDSNEGFDRVSIEMPRNQDLLVDKLIQLNPRTVVYIQSVGVLEIGKFKDDVPAILWTCYNGQAQGNAMARVIFGEHNPTAKLPFTWYADNSQLPTIDDYDLYSEDYENGGWTYQYFTGDVDYPFGHGLSYSSFEFDNLQLSAGVSYQMGDVNGKDGVTAEDALMTLQAATKKIALKADEETRADVDETAGVTANDALMILQAATKKITLPTVGNGDALTPNDTLTATVDVTNTGSVDSKEVVQLYISSPLADGNARPFKQLKAFDKVAIAAGETKTVTLTVDLEDCSFWSEEEQKFICDAGEYTVMVGPSSENEANLTDTFTVAGEYKPYLSVVTADPDKVVLNVARPDKVLTAEVTAAMSDDSFYDIEDAEVTYETNRPEVAVVDENGIVTAVGEGVATITVTVTVDGVTETDSFPVAVINELKIDSILLDGEKMETFEAKTTDYYYPVAGTTAPVVSVPDMGDEIDVQITQATAVPGVATVKVSYGSKNITYTINFRPQSEEYLVATFGGADGRYTASKGTLNVNWITVDGGQPVDLMAHRLSDLYLNLTITLKNEQAGLEDTDAFKGGYIKLRSVDASGENNRGWGISPLKLKSGVNYVSIPLSRVSEISETGTIDWTRVDRFNMYIDSTNQHEGPFTMFVDDVMIVDTRYNGTVKHLQAMVDDAVNEDDYVASSYANYQTAKEAAQAVLDKANATDGEIQAAIADLQAAKEALERKVDKTQLSEAINKEFDEDLYTEDSVERYKAVLAEATLVLNNDEATQAEVDEAIRMVENARKRLKRPNTQPVLATFGNFNREYSAVADNWLYNSTLYADWSKAENAPINLDGDRSDLYLIMTMTFKAPEGTDMSACWDKMTIKLRSEDTPGENNYGWDLLRDSEEVIATATPGVYKILIPLTKENDNATGNMDWATTERIITTVDINGTGDYRVLAGRSDLTMTLSDTQIIDSTLFDLEAWKAE